jgi:hypothetical protein
MKKRMLIISAALLIGITVPQAAGAFEPSDGRPPEPVAVKLWLEEANGAVLRPGERVEIYFQAVTDCYVAVYNIDTEGFVNLLFPRYGGSGLVQGERILSIPGSDEDYDLIVRGPRGIEYVVAVASPYPLNLNHFGEPDQGWRGAGFTTSVRITGDPHASIYEINEALAWGNDSHLPDGIASDVGWFYIESEVPYPRYLVYDWYPEYYWSPWWDPYDNAYLFVDFHWGHDWCGPHYWHHGYHPHDHYNHWYTLHGSTHRVKWKNVVYVDGWRPPPRDKRSRSFKNYRAPQAGQKGPRVVKTKAQRKDSGGFTKWIAGAVSGSKDKRATKPAVKKEVRGQKKPSKGVSRPAKPAPEKKRNTKQRDSKIVKKSDDASKKKREDKPRSKR